MEEPVRTNVCPVPAFERLRGEMKFPVQPGMGIIKSYPLCRAAKKMRWRNILIARKHKTTKVFHLTQTDAFFANSVESKKCMGLILKCVQFSFSDSFLYLVKFEPWSQSYFQYHAALIYTKNYWLFSMTCLHSVLWWIMIKAPEYCSKVSALERHPYFQFKSRQV